MDSNADQLRVSNQLLKLRETIMDNGEKGTYVTVPRNIHLFPSQLAFRMLGFGSLAGVVIGSIVLCMAYEKERLAKCAEGKANAGDC